MVFKSKKTDLIFKAGYSFIFLFIFGIAFVSYLETGKIEEFFPPLIISLIILVIILLAANKMKIIVDGEFLIVNCFFNLYKTNIKNITKIRKGETMWSGLHKYGTTTKGLIVFSKFKNDLYITPEKEEMFYQKILEINPNIIIEKV